MDYSRVHGVGPTAVDALNGEVEHQHDTLVMIASESHVNEAVLEARGSALANKYAEGYPGKHYYVGYEYTGDVETLAVERTEELWGAEHVNAQPHPGTQASMGAYLAMLDPGGKILSLDLTHDGHLNHGHPVNFTGKLYDVEQYGVDTGTGRIDYDQPAEKAAAFEPDIIVSSYSAYPRAVEWETVQKAADDVDALHLADIAHITGLVAAGVHPSPISIADFVTGSAHKTIRAGRGGVTMCDEKYTSDINSTVLPGAQDSLLMHNITGKTAGFKEAPQPEFEEYAQQVVDNAEVLTKAFEDRGLSVVSDGTDTRLVLIDLRNSHLNPTGNTTEEALESTGIVLNANTVPGETRSAFNPNGIRADTPGFTTRDFGEDEIREVGELIVKVIDAPEDDNVLAEISKRVQELCDANPLYE